MFKDYFKMAFQSLSRRQLRSWLTLIGIFIGIAAVVALISLGQGMQESILGEFEKLGGDKLFIQAKSELGSVGAGATNTPLTLDDVRFLEGLNGVDRLTHYIFGSARVEFQDTVHYHDVMGIPNDNPDKLELLNAFYTYGIEEGRQLEQGDTFSAALGYYHGTRNIWNGRNVQVNNKIYINGQKFNVVGILGSTGSPPDDRQILISDDAFRDAIDDTDRVDGIVLQVKENIDISDYAEEVTRQLGRYRGNREGEEDFTVQTPEDLLSSFQLILDIVQAVLVGIAGVSLFVGGVGIMNTMYTSVVERNKDIGVMKAIGARNEDVFTLFLIESGMLGLAGGVIGVLLGSGLAWLVEFISAQALGRSFLQAYFSWELIVGALLFSFLVGALAGTLPAIQASKLNPVDTLRDE